MTETASERVAHEGVEPQSGVEDVNGKAKTVRITPEDFFAGMAINEPEVVQAVVTLGPPKASGEPSFIHDWNAPGDLVAESLAGKSKGAQPGYFTPAAFKADSVTSYKGRTKSNALYMPGFCADVEGSAKKYAKLGGPEKGYQNGAETKSAVKNFAKATGLKPNYMVTTGSGGVHLYWRLAEQIGQAEWLPLAKLLVNLAAQHGFKIDAQCTTDAARIMRAPGSIHQDTGKEVKAFAVRTAAYTREEFAALVGCAPSAADESLKLGSAPDYATAANSDDLLAHVTVPKPYSYKQAAGKCGAMRKAAEDNGRGTDYSVWYIAAKTAALSAEGRDYAHEISSGHVGYNEATTEQKIDSLTGGPAGCDAWAEAYGANGPCDSCEWKGKISNPAVQLGALVDTTVPGAMALTETVSLPDWVLELNDRYALVRHGARVVIVDFQTPSIGLQGMTYGMGFLEIAAFRCQLNGRTAPAADPKDKPRPLAEAWLAHVGRRQYGGLVFSPSEVLPGSILNLWQGFAVTAAEGDVSIWLELLAALVPKAEDQTYVLRWLAWKIQNPGGVPDTILIFTGAKGTGKNSLFDPILSLAGRHGMLVSDPDLIAGRFTWHLMTLILCVLDEAVFIGDHRQSDRIKSRVTATAMLYEQKGMDPVQGVNRCAYVMLTNHAHVWQATTDERRAVVIETGEGLRGNLPFFTAYHAWVKGAGPAALLYYLQGIDLTGFNPRQIPKGEALRKQIERTALRSSAAAWWNHCLTEGEIRYRHDGTDFIQQLHESECTEIDRAALRLSYEQSAAAKTRNGDDWAAVSKKVKGWAGLRGIASVRAKAVAGAPRGWLDLLPPLFELKEAFTAATHVEVAP